MTVRGPASPAASLIDNRGFASSSSGTRMSSRRSGKPEQYNASAPSALCSTTPSPTARTVAAARVTRPVAGLVRVIVTVSPIECSSNDRGVSRLKSKLLSANGRSAFVTIADCGSSVSTTSSMTSVTADAGRSTVRVSVTSARSSR